MTISWMKVNRNGQAEILSSDQLGELLAELPYPHRLIAAICYYTTSRVGEVCQLKAEDIRGSRIVFRRANTKTKRTKEVSIPAKLKAQLELVELPQSGYLFPGKKGDHITRQAFDHALRETCDYLGFQGVSTHSFRRSSITALHYAGVPLKTIQKRSGHATISQVGAYIEELDGAVDAAGELL
ncbi:MAG: tyrosine-type recombinase/integrase [Leptolyngbyaceae cyanobacterium bins.302]|nr:tyrosine-type recombinase/integrase [Leptolyngbyaceae cyanobacterium bins.302]